MRLTAPSKLFFLISLILFALGVVEIFQNLIPVPDPYLLVAGWVVLALGVLMKGI